MKQIKVLLSLLLIVSLLTVTGCSKQKEIMQKYTAFEGADIYGYVGMNRTENDSYDGVFQTADGKITLGAIYYSDDFLRCYGISCENTNRAFGENMLNRWGVDAQLQTAGNVTYAAYDITNEEGENFSYISGFYATGNCYYYVDFFGISEDMKGKQDEMIEMLKKNSFTETDHTANFYIGDLTLRMDEYFSEGVNEETGHSYYALGDLAIYVIDEYNGLTEEGYTPLKAAVEDAESWGYKAEDVTEKKNYAYYIAQWTDEEYGDDYEIYEVWYSNGGPLWQIEAYCLAEEADILGPMVLKYMDAIVQN